MNHNVIDFSKFIPSGQAEIDTEAAKKYFINEVLPFASMASLQRLITANISNNSQLVQLEMMRIFIESQLMRPADTDTNNLELFFAQS